MDQIRAGELPHRIDIEARTGATADRLGAWAPVYTSVPSNVRPRSSKERVVADRPNALTSHEVTLRYLPGITTAHRVKFGSRILPIAGFRNVDERNRVLELDCTEGA